MFCGKCGKKLNDGIKFCPICGTPVPQMTEIKLEDGNVNADNNEEKDEPKDEPKPKNQKYMILVAAIVVVVIAGVIATAFYFLNNNQPQKVSVTNSNDNASEEKNDEETDKVDSSQENINKNELSVESEFIGNDKTTESADNQEIRHTYQLVLSDSTWTDAYKNAQSIKGGSLVNIESQEEMDEILQLIKDQGYEKYVFWIGTMRRGDSYEYYWVNQIGDNNDSELNESSYWLSGEPSYFDSTNNADERYVAMFHSSDEDRWVWNDVPNDISQYYSGKIAYIVEVEDE